MADTEQAKAIDAAAFIAGVKREDLEEQIAEAKQEADRAIGRHRSLLSLRKMIDYHDGLFGPKRRKKAEATAPAAKETVAGDSPADDDDWEDEEEDETQTELVDKVSAFLKRNRTMASETEIARTVGASIMDVKAVLRGNSQMFKQPKPGFWTNW